LCRQRDAVQQQLQQGRLVHQTEAALQQRLEAG
jgi:hypothetical protein